MIKALAFCLALASCQPQLAVTAPSQPEPAPWIFVFHDPHNPWFYSGFKATPTGNSLGGIPITRINRFGAVRNPYCYVQQVERSSFVGVDRATQLEIESDFKRFPHDPFRQEFVAPDGRKLIARVGLAEECESKALRTVVLVQEVSSGWIEHVDVNLNLFLFLFPPNEGGSITKSTCLTCDHNDLGRLIYDAEKRDFNFPSVPERVDQPPPTQLSLGQVIDPYPNGYIDGWSVWSGSDMSRRVESQSFIMETGECCTALFFKGSSYLIVRTVPVSKLPTSGFFDRKGRIVETLKIDPLPNEELMECSLLWIEPAASMVNQKTNEVRSFVATPDGIRLIKWTYEGDACYFEDRN